MQVVATEVSKPGVAAARRNLELNGISNAFVARMSSEEFTSAWKTKKKMTRYVCVCGGGGGGGILAVALVWAGETSFLQFLKTYPSTRCCPYAQR